MVSGVEPNAGCAARERRNVVLSAVVFACAIIVLAVLSVWSYSRLAEEQARDQAVQMAHITMNKDLNLRKWVAELGGIYAPITPNTLPNRWLPREGRDFTLPNGQAITRINPAYAYRLVQQYWQSNNSGWGRLVSLKPIRPQNKADAWEERALRELAVSGEKEKMAEDVVDGVRRMRLLRVLRAEKSCLACHAEYGFSEGDILGGMSIIPPLDEVSKGYRTFGYRLSLFCILVASLCLVTILLFTRRLLQGIRQRDASTRQMEELLAYMDKQVEERTRQLRAANMTSLRLLNATDDAIIGVNEENRIVFVNRTCSRILGYRESDLLDKRLHEVLCPLDSDGCPIEEDVCRLCRALQRGRTHSFESTRFRVNSGKVVLASGRGSGLVEDGVHKGGILAFRDISKARMAELWQKVFFNQAREIFFIIASDHRIVDCNMAAVEWLGLSSKSQLLREQEHIYPACQEDGTRTAEALRYLFSRCDAEGVVRFSWLFRHADGRILPCEGSIVGQKTSIGRGYFAALHDLEPVRAYEQQLDSERSLLQNMVEGAPSSMLVCDENYRILACNTGARMKLGVRRGEPCLGIWEERDAFEEIYARLQQGQSYFKTPMRLRSLDDASSSYHMLLTANRISWRNGQAILLWLQDVTEITALRLAAEASARSKSIFLAQMSHEIRTPLNVIIGMSQIAGNNLHDREKAKNALGQVLTSSRHLLAILNDILDISKIEYGKMELAPMPDRISDIYRDACYITQGSCNEKHLHFEMEVAELPDIRILVDTTRLSQVFINLLGNAVKFTPSGGKVCFGARVTEESAAFITLAFRIADTGIGMEEAQIARLFKPFEQADTSTSRRFGGTGLGLAISQSLVRMMGGEIQVASQKGQGSVFSFELVFPKVEKEEEDASCQSLEGLDLGGRNILLVEDIAINREIVKEALSVTGANVVEAGDGVEALEIFHASGSDFFACIFMDVQMPRMDGHEACRLIRAMPNRYAAEVPIVAMTANAFSEDVEAARACGMNAYLSKPLDLGQLRQVLETWLVKRHQPEADAGQSAAGKAE